MRRLVVLFCLFLLCIQEIYAQQQVSDELRAYNDYLLSLSCYKASGELNMAIGEKFMEGDIRVPFPNRISQDREAFDRVCSIREKKAVVFIRKNCQWML